MYMQRFASALAASAVVAGVAAVGCSDSTVKITSQADAEQAAACRTIKGNIVIDTDDNSNTDLDFQGLQEVKGDFTAKGNKGLQSIMANDLTTIGGVFTLTNLIKLSTLQMQKLEETAGIDFSTLTNLASFDFGYATGGTGITKADSVTIVDTFLQSIDGINVKDPSTIQIISNDRLSNFTSTVETLSDIVVVRDNALQLSVAFPELIWASNITVQNASSLEVPNLKVVNGSLRIENNIFKSFEAPKLTETSEGDIAFISNGDMTKMSFPVFTECAGGFTIANNTKLTAIDGFPKLETIGGAGALRGSFKTVKLDSLESVKGGFDIVSTESIADVCTKFKAMDGSEIQGKVFCDPNNADANSDTSTADSNGSGKGGKNGDGDSAASIMGMSMSTVMSIAGLGMMFTML